MIPAFIKKISKQMKPVLRERGITRDFCQVYKANVVVLANKIGHVQLNEKQIPFLLGLKLSNLKS